MTLYERNLESLQISQKAKVGDQVICNGSGRKWVNSYKGQIGKYINPHDASNTDIIRFANNETILLYSDEYDIVSLN